MSDYLIKYMPPPPPPPATSPWVGRSLVLYLLLILGLPALRLLHVVAWSWWWVLAPLWGPWLLLVLLALLGWLLRLTARRRGQG